MKPSSLVLALFLLGTLQPAGAVAAPVPTSTPPAADAAWAELQSLNRLPDKSPDNAGQMSRRERIEWAEQRALQHRERALAFIEQYPADPRRWIIVDRLYPGSPRFVKDWGPLDEQGVPSKPVVDEAAAAAWKARVEELKAALAKATDVPDELKQTWAAREEAKQKAAAQNQAFFARWSGGQMAPDFVMHDAAGREVKLSDFRGKVVVLDFWAPWCGPCNNAMPHTQEVAARYRDQGVVVLGSCTQDTRANFEAWVKKNGEKYRDIVWACDPAEKGDERASKKLYGVLGIPTQFVIDREGKVVDLVLGYLQGEVILDAALAKAGVKVDSALVTQGTEQRKKRDV